MQQTLAGVLVVASLGLGAASQDDDFVPLFDGRTLDGWVNVNCAPDTFQVRDGVIAVTGVPICEIRTTRMYENFVLDLEYQHVEPMGNAGVFIWADALPARGQPFLRAIEVQVLDGRDSETYTSHGDVFAIHGAVLTPDRPHPKGAMRSLPIERRAKGPGEWNHYRITARDGTISLAVNGKAVSGGYDISPRKGYIALESEGAPVLFRNIRLRELPPSTTPLDRSRVAMADVGHTALYDGKSFTGWERPPAEADRWTAKDWTIAYAGPSPGQPMMSTSTYGDVEVIVDWRLVDAGATASPSPPVPLRDGGRVVVATTQGDATRPAGEWNRVIERVERGRRTRTVNGQVVLDRVPADAAPGRIALLPTAGRVEFANVFVKPLP